MLVLKVTLQLIVGVTAIVAALLDYVSSDRRTSKFKKLRNLLLALMICSLVTSIFVVVDDEKTKGREMAGLRGQISELNIQLESAKKSITGGNNFPYVHIDVGAGDFNDPMLVAVNDGDSPLYDISFRMYDPSDSGLDKNPTKSIEEFMGRSINRDVGNLNPHSVKVLGRIKLKNVDFQKFEITIIARNGRFTERYRLRKVNGIWERAYRVHSGYLNREDSTVLSERIDPGYPVDEAGKVQWE